MEAGRGAALVGGWAAGSLMLVVGGVGLMSAIGLIGAQQMSG